MDTSEKAFRETLLERGWTPHEIEEAYGLTQEDSEHEKKYAVYAETSNVILYWMMLLDLGVCNLIISMGLVPFLIALRPLYIYPMVMVLGFGMGIFFAMIIGGLGRVGVRHHYAAMLFIPSMAVINMAFITAISNAVARIMNVTAGFENPLLVGLFYVIAFIVPYVIGLIRAQAKKKKIQQEQQREISHSMNVSKIQPGAARQYYQR